MRAGDDAILTCIFTYYSKEGWVVKYQEFFLPILIPEKEPVFLFLMLSAKQGKLPGTIFITSGMSRFLTEDWTRVLSRLKPALYHKAIKEAVYWGMKVKEFHVLVN